MSSQTALLAEQYRLREWAQQIRDCQNRPEGMSVVDWCARNGLTKANYYYRLRRVRKACLDSISAESVPQPVVPVPTELMNLGKENNPPQGVAITAKGFSICVTEDTPAPLLAKVLEVIRHVE